MAADGSDAGRRSSIALDVRLEVSTVQRYVGALGGQLEIRVGRTRVSRLVPGIAAGDGGDDTTPP